MVVKGAGSEWGACFRTVFPGFRPYSLSCWNNIIAIGASEGDIISLDATTGSRITTLSGHTDTVECVTFSSDGRSLASGAYDKTVKLWDMQTGGVVRTFLGHTEDVCSVSISGDNTRIVSGSKEIHLWDIQTGECLHTIQISANHVIFSPIDPQHIIFISGGTAYDRDINGQQVPLKYSGSHIAFSPDCKKFTLCDWDVIVVRDSNSKAIETLSFVDTEIDHCCFSPDGRLFATAKNKIAYIWDITNSESHIVGTLIGHHYQILSLVFSSPSSLVSISDDSSIRFWQIDVLPADSVITNPKYLPPISSAITSVGLQARPGIAVSCDREGIVKIWDISTGLCKASFQTPARDYYLKDARLIDGKLIIAWEKYTRFYIWEAGTDGSPKVVFQHLYEYELQGLRISGDGSKVFCLFEGSIQARSIHTGELVGEVKLELEHDFYLDPLQMDGSKIWIRHRDLSIQGWDLGVPNSLPVPLSDRSAERPLLDFIGGPSWMGNKPSRVKNTVTGKEIFQLFGRYVKPGPIQWDGRYLIAGYESGEVLILDFHYLYPQ